MQFLTSCIGSSLKPKKSMVKQPQVQQSLDYDSTDADSASDEDRISTKSSSSTQQVQQVQKMQKQSWLKPKRRRPSATVSPFPSKYFTKETKESDDKLVGVVVTIFSGCSYDPMFREVEPSTVPGERISTYSIGCVDVKLLHDYLVAAMPVPEAWQSLVEELQSVEPDSVIFNWECCDSVDKSGFPRCQQAPLDDITMNFMRLALHHGYTVMCSDFSLKALITDWSEDHLGPNPFLNIGETSGQVKLDFQPSDLENDEVPQQLQVVGQLCRDRGNAIVHTLSGTVVYTVNPKRPATDVYTLKVLTVASDLSEMRVPEHLMCSVGEGEDVKRGAAAHVTLTYANGGQIITSMAHWIELTKVDTSLEAVMRCAAQEFGEVEVRDLQAKLSAAESDEARYECLQSQSKQMISKSAPSRMKTRTKFSASEVLSKC